MKTIINEMQCGLMFKNGRFVKLLPAGKYHTFGATEIEICALDQEIQSSHCSHRTLLENAEFQRCVTVFEIPDKALGLHFVNGRFFSVLRHGTHVFWSKLDEHTCITVDTTSPRIGAEVPEYVLSALPAMYVHKIEVAQHQKARLYFDCRFVELLDAGIYYFWRSGTRIDFDLVDTRLLQMDVSGQEILTRDKVTLRINFVCNYRVTDYVKIATEIDDHAEQLHVAAQLALREYVGKYRLDEILENKEEMSAFVCQKLKEKESSFFVEIESAAVKDIILPGEVREIMNTVLVAEKRAQANVITRREEVASTRSLLNTAKLMEENQTLYKLKELEYVERIFEHVGSVNLNANGDLLTQLCGILKGRT